MDKYDIIKLVETGEGDIWNIIEYYAENKNINELLDCINDPVIGSLVLYIGSELPPRALTREYVAAVENLLKTGSLSGRGAYCAEDIVESGRELLKD
ncbi:hypothetical protein [Nitrospirillum sp. BR 11163]|uniref:hypothetical protein n=1 Tax=Nitrospirillum sp. BR 11163 TaxID=3104323 RepID=UPI002AFEBC3B|nr:hypothetical protein [Nitrospirillum sp. BR 11163]MEA1673716.1 hypothetical protein [Nitrospirillum sp. BR 11163]